jgi:hypothetical protein
MKLLAILLLLPGFSAWAKNDASSAAVYEYLASKGYEAWRTNEGGFIQMQTFSCNSTFLKQYKLQLNQCWYTASKNNCHSDERVTETDDKIATGLFQAMAKMGLPIPVSNEPDERWSQIDADGLNCMMTLDHTTEPASKSYVCWAMKKLKS